MGRQVLTNKGMKYKKHPRLLESRQEAYCQNIAIKGMGVREAAREAGFAPGSSGGVSKQPAVQARIMELRNKKARKAIAEVEERKEILTEIIRKALPDRAFARDTIAATAELNKMEGAYTPEKQIVEKIYSFVFILPDGTRILSKQIDAVEGKVVRSD